MRWWGARGVCCVSGGLTNPIQFVHVGYHNDFPRVPWYRLAVLKATAPGYYDTLPVCSWCGVIWRYIFDNRMGPHGRKINE